MQSSAAITKELHHISYNSLLLQFSLNLKKIYDMNQLKKTTAKHLSFLQMMDKLSALLFTENYHLSDEAYRTVKRITKHLNQLIERHEQDLRDNKMRKQEQTTC